VRDSGLLGLRPGTAMAALAGPATTMRPEEPASSTVSTSDASADGSRSAAR